MFHPNKSTADAARTADPSGALVHFEPRHLEPPQVPERPHREVPNPHVPVHLEVRELRLGV